MKRLHCVDKLLQFIEDDRIQTFGLVRVHGKHLHGYAFVTVAVSLIMGWMAVVCVVLSSCNCRYQFVGLSFVCLTFDWLLCTVLSNSTFSHVH